jgi:hypothetical protein
MMRALFWIGFVVALVYVWAHGYLSGSLNGKGKK